MIFEAKLNIVNVVSNYYVEYAIPLDSRGAKDEIKRLEGPLARSQAPEGPLRLLVIDNS